MSEFSKNVIVKNCVVVRWRGKSYTSADGLTRALAARAADRIMCVFGIDYDKKTYGYPDYTRTLTGNPPMTNSDRYRFHHKRLSRKFYRRAIGIIRKGVFQQ